MKYYNLLDRKKQNIYEKLYENIKKRHNRVLLVGVDEQSILNVFELLLLDHPEIFYVDNCIKMSIIPINTVLVHFKYVYKDNEITEIGSQIIKELNKIETKISNMSERNKIYWINDYIFNRGKYIRSLKTPIHNIDGFFVLKQGCCENFAKSFKLICDFVGIESLVAVGSVDGEKHAWNIVKDKAGKTLYIDVTFNIGSHKRYKYISDKKFLDRIQDYDYEQMFMEV